MLALSYFHSLIELFFVTELDESYVLWYYSNLQILLFLELVCCTFLLCFHLAIEIREHLSGDDIHLFVHVKMHIFHHFSCR